MGSFKDEFKPLNIWGGTSSVDSNSNIKSGDTPPSRLSYNSDELRRKLVSRNLYTEFTQYPLQENDKQKIVNSVSSLMDKLLPFKSFNLSNSVIGRLVSTPQTPLTDIGLIMLGKQFALNFQSNLTSEVFPTINLRNLFDGNSNTKLFQKKVKYNITRKTEGTTVEDFIEDFFGYHPRRNNIFNYKTTNKEYLQNTGVGQLDFLFGNSSPDNTGGLNKNIYKPVNRNLTDYTDAAEQSGNKIYPRAILMEGNRTIFYDFAGSTINNINLLNTYNPYVPFELTPDAEDEANDEMVKSYVDSSTESGGQEYAPNKYFVRDYMGQTDKGRERKFGEDNDWIGRDSEFNDNVNDQFIWGFDGVSDRANNRLSKLRGVDNTVGGDSIGSGSKTPKEPKDFKIRTGLLEYTRNLLNATEGQVVDQTRKLYKKGDELVGINGSGLWKAPDFSLKTFSGKTGIRQHSVLDQYDRFAKAIRFEGNQVYGGNPDSVIYNSVLPRIHPVWDRENNKFNNKNLMFSIENLAVVAVGGDDSYGIIDDEYGTLIPRSEVGPFNGRIMWFPPYGLNLNEVATAKYNSTVVFGRNEPIYNYTYSERSATISFMLIIDYPEQVKNFLKNGSHKELAEFFGFGGPEFNPQPYINNASKKEFENRNKIVEFEGPTKKTVPDVTLPSEISISFPNDIPQSGNIGADVIDKMYLDYRYEIIDGLNSVDGTGFGLNEDIYLKSGVTIVNGEVVFNPPSGFSQANAPYIAGQRVLDDSLFNLFNDPDNVKYFKINIVGGATALYTPGIENPADTEKSIEYNKNLGLRRAEVAKAFIIERIKKIFPDTYSTILQGLTIETNTDGRRSENYDTKDSIPERGAKEERTAIIRFEQMFTPIEPKKQSVTSDVKQNINTLKNENLTLQASDNVQKRNSGSYDVMEERTSDTNRDKDGAILKGFQSITGNYFYPAFHSQTPEDFHKRLTFLQQCTRQGSAIRSTAEKDQYGITRVKNSVFGRQPICILRIGDFFYTKVIIENVTIDYDETVWDTNPEGFGMQPMIAKITLQMKVLGGQSLKGPIDALQNAVSFNYYANSTFTDRGIYATPTNESDKQQSYIEGVLSNKEQQFKDEFKAKFGETKYNEIFGE